MVKSDYIKTRNSEKLGEYYFQKGLFFLMDRQFEKAYEFFKESLDYVTCDCEFITIIKDNILPKNIFNDIENGNVNHHQYFFVKAMMLSHSNKIENSYLALESIEKYLSTENNEYGNYIKGKTLLRLNRKAEALEYFTKALNISTNSRLNYRVGRYLCDNKDKSGISKLFNAFIENPSSSCCLSQLSLALSLASQTQNLKTTVEFLENELVAKFVYEKNWVIRSVYKKIYNKQSEDVKHIKSINDFLSFIHFNSDVITGNLTEIEEFYLDKNNNSSNYRNYDDYEEDYGSSFNDEYYNDNLDMDQQSPEFWDSL